MNNNTNENNEFPRTGTPAHNESKPRAVDSISPLSDRYPAYEPNPSCMECGGEGKVWLQVTLYDRDGEAEGIDYEWDPCECIFNYMSVEADPACKACVGTGEVEEAHIADGEKITSFYACICLRYVPTKTTDGDGNSE